VGTGVGSGGIGKGEWGDDDDVKSVEALRVW